MKEKTTIFQSNQARIHLNFYVQISKQMLKKEKCRFARKYQWSVTPMLAHPAQYAHVMQCKQNPNTVSPCLNWDCIQSWFHVIIWVGPDHRRSLVKPPAQSRSNIVNSDQTIRAFSSWVLKSPMDRDPQLPWATCSKAQLHHSPSPHAETLSVQIYGRCFSSSCQESPKRVRRSYQQSPWQVLQGQQVSSSHLLCRLSRPSSF